MRIRNYKITVDTANVKIAARKLGIILGAILIPWASGRGLYEVTPAYLPEIPPVYSTVDVIGIASMVWIVGVVADGILFVVVFVIWMTYPIFLNIEKVDV